MNSCPLLALVTLAACSDPVPVPTDAADDAGAPFDASPADSGGDDAATLPCTPVAGSPALSLEVVATGLDRPVLATAPLGDPRVFIIEQHAARILIARDGAVLSTPFLSLTDLVSTGNEQGLLGLAFAPDFAASGVFYVNYTRRDGDTVIARYHRDAADPDHADAAGAELVLEVAQPFSNHNGGHLAFGPDGFLYIGLGDGGSAGDPRESGQDRDSLLGKMLRIDPSVTPYASPPSNPFAGAAPGRAEIWAFGLRNPWRYAFDRATGDLYIADVGQDSIEEIDFQPASSTGGENYGWNEYEGAQCYDPPCQATGKVFPVHDYPRSDGCSITGGYVYRGCRMPGHHGKYFFADYCDHWIRSLKIAGGAADEVTEWPTLDPGGRVSSFGEDGNGELLIVDHQRGAVYRVVPTP